MPRRGPRWLIALVGATACGPLFAARASADSPEAYELRYEPAPGCPGEAAFRSDVLAHVHDTSRAAGARVRVQIEAQPSGFRGELVATDDEGHEGRRSIDGATCADVAHALAFLAGLAIELGGHLEKSEEPAAPAPPPPVAAPPAPPAPAPPKRTPAPPETLALEPSAVVLGELVTGLSPAIRPALEIAFDLEDRRALTLSHAYRLAIMGAVSDLSRPEGSANLRYLAGRAEGCPLRWGSQPFVLRACLGFELGYMWAESRAAANPRNQGQVWPSGEALLRLKYRILGGLFAELDAAAAVPFLRPKYFFEPDLVLYQVPAVTARGAVGLGYRF